MIFYIKQMTEAEAKTVCSWHYEAPYSIYDFGTWEEAFKNQWTIAIKEIRDKEFFAVYNENEQMIGFFRYTKEDSGYGEVGLGMNPVFCGRGLGTDFIQTIIQYCQQKFSRNIPYMDVRGFNTRAIKCYKKVGFQIVDYYKKSKYGTEIEYVRMEKNSPK